MDRKTKEEIISDIKNTWQNYLEEAKTLTSEELKKQGYENTHDLLAHMIGWNKLWVEDIPKRVADKSYTNDIDTDEFNAQSVKKYKNLSENEMENEYKRSLNDLLNVIEDLSEEDLNDDVVYDWAYNYPIGHYGDHKKSESNSEEPLQDDDLIVMIAKLEKEVQDEKNKKLSLMADFHNYQNRIQQEKSSWGALANMGIIQDILEVHDDMELALNDEQLDLERSKESLKSAQSKIIGAALKAGVEKIEVKVGEDFDKERMEAVSMIPAPSEDQKGKVIAVISSAYKLTNKEGILKPAKVIVGK